MKGICLVGYTYRGYPLAYAAARAKEYGFAGIEVRDFRDVDLSNLDAIPVEAAQAARKIQKYGLAAPAIFLSPIVVSEDRAAEERNERLLATFRPLADAGYEVLHTRLAYYRDGAAVTTAREVSEADLQRCADLLQGVGAAAGEAGIAVCLETHMGTVHDLAQTQLRLMEMVAHPNVKAGLDFANMLIENPDEDLSAVVRASVPKYAGYAHVKNLRLYDWGYDWAIPVELGDINYRRVLGELLRCGYNGWLGVEYCGTGNPDVFARRDAAYLRLLLADLRPGK